MLDKLAHLWMKLTSGLEAIFVEDSSQSSSVVPDQTGVLFALVCLKAQY